MKNKSECFLLWYDLVCVCAASKLWRSVSPLVHLKEAHIVDTVS